MGNPAGLALLNQDADNERQLDRAGGFKSGKETPFVALNAEGYTGISKGIVGNAGST